MVSIILRVLEDPHLLYCIVSSIWPFSIQNFMYRRTLKLLWKNLIIKHKFLQVMSVHTTFSTGQWDTICTTATVERHLSCQCSCKQKPEHCNNQIHFYDSASCTCQCKSQAERAVCNTGNGNVKKWDSKTCSCMCPRTSWRLCSTGYTYDFRDSW